MSVNHHTAITTGAAANAATVNGPLGELDAAIDTEVDAITSGLTAGRVVYVGAGPILDDDAGFEYNDSTDTLTVETVTQTYANAGHFLTNTVTIADDEATSFTPSQLATAGMIIVFPVAADAAKCTSQTLIASFRSASSGLIGAVVLGSETTVTSGTALTGTTGTDAKMNVSCHTDGKIYIENRLGASNTFFYIIIG